MDLHQHLIIAIRQNKITRIERLIREGADPGANNNVAIRIAAGHGHFEIVRLLLADPRVDPAANDNKAIKFAINGHLAQNACFEVVRLLLADPRVDPSVQNNFLIRIAVERAHTDVVRLLLADPRVNSTAIDNGAIKQAFENGHSEIVKLLAEIPGVIMPAIDHYISTNEIRKFAGICTAVCGSNDILNWGARVGSVNLVRHELSKGVDPRFYDYEVFRIACGCGRTEVVRILLENPQVDPTTDGNYPIRHAAENGHLEVVRLLLADPRVDPSAHYNFAFRYAAQNLHFEVATLLLTDPRVDPTGSNNSLFRYAVYLKQQNLVLFLFNLPGVLLPTIEFYLQEDDLDQIKELAAMTGAYPTSDTDPSIDDPDLMVWGAAVGSLALVQFLIEQKNVDPHFANDSALVVAHEKGHLAIVTYLSAFPI